MLPSKDESAKIDEVNTARVRVVLDRYGPELTPDAPATLAPMWKDAGKLPPDKLAEKISRNLALPGFARYHNPEHVPAKLENGAEASPLRKVLSRHALDLKAGAVDELARDWQSELGNLDEPRLAGEVAKRLASRDVAERFAETPPAPPERESLVREAIVKHFPEVNQYKAGELAREIEQRSAGKAGRMPEHLLVRHVAEVMTLNHPSRTKFLKAGASALSRSDPRLKQGVAGPREGTDRLPGGRF